MTGGPAQPGEEEEAYLAPTHNFIHYYYSYSYHCEAGLAAGGPIMAGVREGVGE